MRTVLQFAQQLPTLVRSELEQILASLAAFWDREHHADGTHGDVTADNLSVENTIHANVTSVLPSLYLDTSLGGGLDFSLSAFRFGVSNAGFEIRDETNAAARVSIDGSGNVGIGTASPAAPLAVHTSGMTVNNTPATSGTVPINPMGRFSNNRGVSLDIGGQYWSPWGIWLQVADTSALGSEYPLLLNPNGGNVGIGTATPGSKLSVVGLPTYADNTAALAGGLVAGDFYRTSTGVLMVTY